MSTTTESARGISEVQYVYIPNLVGRQMLRIPLSDLDEECEESGPAIDENTNSTDASATLQNGSAPLRDVSPARSEESVSAEE